MVTVHRTERDGSSREMARPTLTLPKAVSLEQRSTTADPKKHHFSPVFYLKGMVRSDGFKAGGIPPATLSAS
jgi:hypothetical protein